MRLPAGRIHREVPYSERLSAVMRIIRLIIAAATSAKTVDGHVHVHDDEHVHAYETDVSGGCISWTLTGTCTWPWTAVGRPLFIGIILLLVLAGFLGAHPSRHVKRQELHILADRLVLFQRYEVSEPRFATDLRERFNLDGDRILSSGETASLLSYIQDLALRDLTVSWDGLRLRPVVAINATSGMDRELPSAYPLVIYCRVDFALPEDVRAPGTVHQLEFEDRERVWKSRFTCTIRLGPGVEVAASDGSRSFEFSKGQGSFRMPILLPTPIDAQLHR